VVLEIAPLQTLTGIAKRGFRLAFDHTVLTRPYARWLPLASFIKLDLFKLPPEAVSSVINLAQTGQHCRN
jgi:EAL and modified HD-GYP domain-containing signal transduction protein